MTILSRILRLCKADLHGVMDQIEDKGLLLKQYLREMESALRQKEARRSRLNETCRQIQRDLSLQESEGERLEKGLELAVRMEKDDIARMLIRKRRTLHACRERLQRQLWGLQMDSQAGPGDLRAASRPVKPHRVASDPVPPGTSSPHNDPPLGSRERKPPGYPVRPAS